MSDRPHTWPLIGLLADSSPCLRWLVLRELVHATEEGGQAVRQELDELAAVRGRDALVAPLLAAQESDGAWRHGDIAWQGDAVRMTMLALMRLGYLDFGPEHPAVASGAAYLFSQQRDDGAWGSMRVPDEQDSEAHEGYAMVPLQTALPLRALAMCGYATDPRAERAYAWLMDQRLDDGAWPTGKAAAAGTSAAGTSAAGMSAAGMSAAGMSAAGMSGAGTYGYVAGYRKMPHSRWGCRSNTTGALLCLAHHPERRVSPEAQRTLDLLLGRETRETGTLGFEVARLTGAVPTRGFMTFYGRFDLAQILDLGWRIGATLDDPRVAEIVAFVRDLQGPYGLWNTEPPQASRWVTFDLLRSLTRLEDAGDWVSHEPRTPFQTYPKPARRY